MNSRAPLNNVSNNPSEAAADIRELMATRTAKKIQPAAKETVNNSATVLEGSRKIYVHMVASCPGTEASNVLGVVARHFPETVSFNGECSHLNFYLRVLTFHRCS